MQPKKVIKPLFPATAGKSPLEEGERAININKNFIRKKEDFRCDNCGTEVIGDGYTDHCPYCLWGRHVDDIVPGDRASLCGQMMEPMRTEYRNGVFKIYYKCSGCKHEFGVREAKEDNRDRLVELCK